MKNENTRQRFNWRLPLYTALATISAGLLDAFAESGVLYLLLVVVVSLVLFAVLLFAAVEKKSSLCLAILSTLAVFWILSFAYFRNHYAIRNAARWSLESHRYKAEVLAQPNSANDEFKHVEWDGWGFPGAGDTTVYLAFDPADSLAAAAKRHQPGKFEGIPCKVLSVSRLENRWYAVLFYTDERWGTPNRDCSP